MKTIILYNVLVSYGGIGLEKELDNIYPTAESAIRRAKHLIVVGATYAEVNKIEVSENAGCHFVESVFSTIKK